MDPEPVQRETRRATLAEIFKDVRALRALSRQAVARRMGMEPRTYERFEAGDVRIDLERVLQFAKATDSDPLAILTSLHQLRPELALRCADNKLMLVQALCIERLSDQLGDRLRTIDAATLIDVLDRAFAELVREVEAKDRRTREWFARSKTDRKSEPPGEDGGM